jgi:phosphatidylserine decarboxylase
VPAWALVALGAWGVSVWGGWVWAGEALVLLFAVWLIVFFRDPRRLGPRGDQFLVAPADGRIVEIAVVREPMYLKEEATRISTFMNVFNVHVNRYPVSGEVALVHYNPGKFLHAGSEKASLENEQASVGIRGPRGGVLVRQIAGLLARRIVTDARSGGRAIQGERLGMIRFGSRVDVFVPQTSQFRLRVAVGDQVRTGASVLGEYVS